MMRHRARRWATLPLLWISLAAASSRPVLAQALPARIVVLGESASTSRRLAAADKLAAQEKWPEAIDEYQHIVDEAGDELVPLPQGYSVQARLLCHLRLASLPAPALRLYRDRIDGQAKKWLEQGKANRDSRWLRRIVANAFCSRFADQALDLLGDLAFERGDFREAEHWWRLLALPATKIAARKSTSDNVQPAELVFPDPQVDVARVRAKQLLARLFWGERDGFDQALEAYRRLHGQAAGDFAGHQGKYADTLQILARQSGAPTAACEEHASWPTFAGDPSRHRVLGGDFNRLSWVLTPADSRWPKPLQHAVPGKDAGTEAATVAGADSLAFFPVIAGNQVLVADARYVTAYDVLTGRLTGTFDLQDDLKTPAEHLDLKLPVKHGQRYTLTVAGNRVFARLGVQALPPVDKGRAEGNTDSFLVCMNLKPDKHGKLISHWKDAVKANTVDTEPLAVFEGAPVVHDGRVYIARTRFTGAQVITSVDCYDADTGERRWRQDVCRIRPTTPHGPRYRHHLLTLAGPNIIYCSHSGAIIALDGRSGRPVWAAHYPSRGATTDQGEPAPRDLCPCVYDGRRLFAAPADFNHIRCLDPDTGRTLWQSEPAVEVVQLLGVGHGRLIFTTPKNIQAVDVATGRALREWLQPSGGGELPPWGRGFLAGDLVFWPTQVGLRVLKQESGEPAEDWAASFLRNQPMGNLAYANGCLAVANATRLWVYTSEARRLEQRRREAAADPQAALAHFRLALAEAATGLDDLGVKDFAHAERLAKPADHWQGKLLRVQARAGRYRLLLAQAEQARSLQQWDKAAAFLACAAGREFPAADRLEALSQQADLWTSAGKPDRAVAVWQSILADDCLRRGSIQDVAGVPQNAAGLAAARMDALIHAHGSALYAPYEQQARTLLGQVGSLTSRVPGDKHRGEVLERLVKEFPNASVTPPALLELAAGHEKAGQPCAAARDYRLFLQRSSADGDRALALAGLARAYDRQGCWKAARHTWQSLASAYGERTWAAIDPRHPIREFVAKQLEEMAKRHETAGSRRPLAAAGRPLATAWQVQLLSKENLIVSEGALSPCESCGLVFFARNNGLACREAATGRLCWARKLPNPPDWIGLHADIVIAASLADVHGLSMADGCVLWRWESYATEDRNSEGHTAPPRYPATLTPHRLSHFTLASSRLFFLEGERRLFVLDAESGRALWAQWAPGAKVEPLYAGGRFYPFYYAGDDWVVVQTGTGKLVVFASRTGRQMHQSQTSREPWPRPPLATDQQHICLVPDRRHIVQFDPATGKEVWRRRTATPSISAQAPQLVRHSKTLLAIIDGWRLESLDPLTGVPRWQGAIATEPVDVARSACDQTAFYFVSRNVLEARALADGSILWKQTLEDGPFPRRILVANGFLIVIPGQAEEKLRRPWSTGGYLITFPWEVEWHDVPVVIGDAKTGRVVRRLRMPAQGPRVAVQPVERGAVLGLAGKAWGLLPVNRP